MPRQVLPLQCWRHHLPGDVAPPSRSPEKGAWRAVPLRRLPVLFVLIRAGFPPVASEHVAVRVVSFAPQE